MRRERAVLLGSLLLAGTSASAHHSHPAFLLDQTVAIEGDLVELKFANPHVLMKVRTGNGTVYTAEWQGKSWFETRDWEGRNTDTRYDTRCFVSVTPQTLKIGDHVVVTGSPHRDQTMFELVVLQEVRRSRDGWLWRSQTRPPTPC
jgi:hypothetical protein